MRSISVSEVLSELRRSLPQDASRPASTRLLGNLFHEIFARLVDPASPDNAMGVIADCDPTPDEWRARLLEHVYDRLLGPLLTQRRTALGSSGAQVLDLWASVQGLADWLVGIASRVERRPETLHGEHWDFLRACFSSEVELAVELREPEWCAPVLLTGRLDSIVQVPERPERCLVELKTGRVPDELALAQLCLYQLAVSEGAPASAEGPLVILRFGPRPEETVVDASALSLVRSRLMELVADLTKSREPPPGNDSRGPSVAPVSSDEDLRCRLQTAFKEFGVEVRADEPAEIGPTFKRYPLTLGRGVRVGRVERLAPDIEVRLGFEGLSLHRHRGRVVADVRREDRQVVSFDALMSGVAGPEKGQPRSQVLVGQEIDGTLRWADLSDPTTAHVLVAGTTGSGKSEWMRTAIGSLIATNTPETLRLVLVDPKRNAFGELAGSPFLMPEHGIVFPPQDSVHEALDALIEEMARRYVVLQAKRADDIADLARREGQVFPRILFVCDEYFDLMASSAAERRELENRIGRLGAKARAAGIHLVLATQQPSRRVVTGTIITNLPARVALKTGSPIESRMILEEEGAERLLGHGDLLYKSVGRPVRAQAPLMSPQTRARLFGTSPMGGLNRP